MEATRHALTIKIVHGFLQHYNSASHNQPSLCRLWLPVTNFQIDRKSLLSSSWGNTSSSKCFQWEHIGKQQHLKLNIIWFIHKMLEKWHKNGFDQQIEGKAERCHEWECRIWLKHLIMDCNPHPGTKTPCSKYQLLVGALKCRRSHFSAQLKWSDSAFVTTTGRVSTFVSEGPLLQI